MTMTSDCSRPRRHQQLIHRIAERLGARLRHSLDHDLIELRLKNVLAHAAVEERRLVERGPHLLDQLAEKRLADEIGERFAELWRVPPATTGCSGRGLRTGGERLRSKPSVHWLDCHSQLHYSMINSPNRARLCFNILMMSITSRAGTFSRFSAATSDSSFGLLVSPRGLNATASFNG